MAKIKLTKNYMIPCGGFTTPMRQLPLFAATTRGRLFYDL